MSTLEERIAVVETELKNTNREVVVMAAKVDEMHSIVQAFKGVRWVVITIAAVAGFIAGKFGTLIATIMGGKP